MPHDLPFQPKRPAIISTAFISTRPNHGDLCAVATDGHRLALTRQALPAGAAQMPSVILPRKAVGELRKLLDDFDGDVLVGLSETRAEFRLWSLSA